MNYLKFTQYAYLLAAILFGIDAFVKWQSNQDYMLSTMFAAVCFFLFFFRRRFGQKFADRNKKP